MTKERHEDCEPQACNLDGSKLTRESVQAYLDQLQTAADADAPTTSTSPQRCGNVPKCSAAPSTMAPRVLIRSNK